MKRNFSKILIAIVGILCANMGFVMASENIDITPPVGRVVIVGSTESGGVSYVDRTTMTIQIYAQDDDESADAEIKYYIGTTPLIDPTIDESIWKTYTDGATEKIDLVTTKELNTIYVAFKDKTGNTSTIYKDTTTEYSVIYDANTGIDAPENQKAYYGMPLNLTSDVPEHATKYFLGWSTNKNATTPSYKQGGIVAADVFKGTGKEITLYAVWTDTTTRLPSLYDSVDIGDYVNYPVYYDNVADANNYITNLSGWRVISKDVDLDGNVDDGRVNLITAGVPLNYYFDANPDESITALTTNFLTTSVDEDGTGTYRESGFGPFKTLTEIFDNKYTEKQDNGVTPQIRSIKQEDILLFGDPEGDGVMGTYNDVKFSRLFEIGEYYWIASLINDGEELWNVSDDGEIMGLTRLQLLGVRPVVSLKKDIKVTGQDLIGGWDIVIE